MKLFADKDGSQPTLKMTLESGNWYRFQRTYFAISDQRNGTLLSRNCVHRNRDLRGPAAL